MTHQDAMKATTRPSNCTGEIVKGNRFDSQDLNWTLGTCRRCGTQIALCGGFSHRFNYVIAEVESRREYRQGYEGMEVPPTQ